MNRNEKQLIRSAIEEYKAGNGNVAVTILEDILGSAEMETCASKIKSYCRRQNDCGEGCAFGVKTSTGEYACKIGDSVPEGWEVE